MSTVAFVYGWAESTWQSQRMQQALIKNGYTLINDRINADILIAHSEGCFWVPPQTKAKVIMLVGLPYWPDRSLFTSVRKKLKEDYSSTHKEDGTLWWLNKLMHNIWYILTKPQTSYYVLTKHKPENFPSAAPGRHIILVRNKADTFCHPEVKQLLPVTEAYQLISFSGGHDDNWSHPQPYIDLITRAMG